MTAIRIVVVDDHALFRAGLISLLSQIPEIVVVGEGSNGQEALQAVEDTQPDILLLDVNMPVMNGVETVTALRKKTEIPILMLTISKQQEDLIGSIQAGANGYLLKSTEPKELYKAISLALEGKSILSSEVTAEVLVVIRERPESFNISGRENEVLRLLADGKSNAQIAEELVISQNTVKTHIKNVYKKLGASNRAEAVSIAIKKGLL
jgi:DNA-binding NarL/FixJ family response regulator